MQPPINQYIRKEAITNGICNVIFNGIIAFFLLKDAGPLPWFGENSFVLDIFATAFILPFIVALIVIALQKRKVRLKKLAPISLDDTDVYERTLNRFPSSMFLCSIIFGMTGLLFFAPATLFLIFLLGIEGFSPINYSIFKGIWAGIIAASLVGPMIIVGLKPTPKILWEKSKKDASNG
jgi:hypothetical protein